MKEADTDERLKNNPVEMLDNFLEELHRRQTPDTFSPYAKSVGWSEYSLPESFSCEVIRRIKREAYTEHCDWRVLASAFGLFVILCFVLIFSTNRMLTPLKPSGQLQVASGLFWLVVALSITAGVFAITVMRFGIKDEAFPHRV